MFTTVWVDSQILYKCDTDAECCKILETYFAISVRCNERYLYKKTQFWFDDVIYKPNHENKTHLKFITFCLIS